MIKNLTNSKKNQQLISIIRNSLRQLKKFLELMFIIRKKD